MTQRKRKNLEALPEQNRAFYQAFLFIEPVDLFNPAEVEERTKQYANYVNENNIAPLWSDFCFAMGYTRQYLHDVLVGTSRTHQPAQTRQILQRVHSWLESSLNQYGLQHPENSVMCIWLSKNLSGYRDSPVEFQLANAALIEDRPRSLEEIKRRNAEVLASVPDLEMNDDSKQLLKEYGYAKD